MAKKIQFQVSLTAEQYDLLKRYSQKYGVPIAHFIRISIDERIAKLKAEYKKKNENN